MSDENVVEVRAPWPKAPCWHCAQRNAVELKGARLGVWCEHTKSGGVFHPDQGMWSIYGPLESEQVFVILIWPFVKGSDRPGATPPATLH